jgi:copper chaperone NosL
MTPIKPFSRALLVAGALSLLATYGLPLWRIDLWAPQYPEGLVLKIWLSKLTGDVDVINGLNHYIGMAHIRAEMFPEFRVLPYVVGFYVAFGLLTALTASRKLLLAYLLLIAAAGLGALYDFWRWGYEYGHNLDPSAPIQVPGMAYQPPLLGYKALLNFGAFSIPDWGGWIFVAVGGLVAALTAYEWVFRHDGDKVLRRGVRKGAVAVALVGAGVGQGCTPRPDPIRYGQDACQFCKMTLVDQRFAAEVVTKKGRSFKFDDLACLVKHAKAEGWADTDLPLVLVADYAHPGTLLDARAAVFVPNDSLRSPMRGDVAAFARTADAPAGAKTYRFGEIRERLSK